MIIIPTILEKDLNEIKKKISIVGPHFKNIQLDLCDGQFVPNITFDGILELDNLETDAILEVDIMAIEPCEYVLPHLKKIKRFCAHVELTDDEIVRFISNCREGKYDVGLCILADSDLALLDPYIDQIDYVQFLSVIPGGQGRDFIPTVLDKVKVFREKYPQMVIQVDGGVKVDNLDDLLNVGVNNAVMGSAIFASENIVETIDLLKEIN